MTQPQPGNALASSTLIAIRRQVWPRPGRRRDHPYGGGGPPGRQACLVPRRAQPGSPHGDQLSHERRARRHLVVERRHVHGIVPATFRGGWRRHLGPGVRHGTWTRPFLVRARDSQAVLDGVGASGRVQVATRATQPLARLTVMPTQCRQGGFGATRDERRPAASPARPAVLF
jgi:hypothetical protein